MKKIGNYQLIAELKRSATGATYRGWDERNRRLVLLKTFFVRAEGGAALFAREAEAYARIAHANIVRLWDYGRDENLCYLVLEFVEGHDLRRVLQQHGALPIEIATGILCETLQGLAEIHRQQLIHRDLKPENILLGQNGEVKLCDFDLAQTEASAREAGVTGSPGYVAPEVILGEALTTRADIFSLGVVFYEMLAGTRPFQAATPSGEMNAIVRLAHLPLNKFAPNAPAALTEVLNLMLAKRAPERCASPQFAQQWLEKYFEVGTSVSRAQALRHYLAGPQEYHATGLVVRVAPTATARPAPRRAWQLYAAILTAALLLSLVLYYAQTQRPVAEPAPLLTSRHTAADSVRPAPTFDSTRAPEGNKHVLPVHSQPSNSIATTAESAAVRSAIPAHSRTLYIRSNPWAYLFVNNDSLGVTPLAVTLPASAKDLVLKNPKFPRINIPLQLETLTHDTITFSLWEQVAQLELQITPWAEIYVNNEHQFLNEGQKSLLLLPGKYHLRFVHAQLGEKAETISLRAGEVRRLTVNMF